MTRRDLTVAIVASGVTLAVAIGYMAADRGLLSPAHAQQPSVPEQQRQLLLAVASAVASVAVDGERTAMTLNETRDELTAVRSQLRALEQRLGDLEKKR